MVFQQLFEPVSSTYTYLVADPDTREAGLIDSVLVYALPVGTLVHPGHDYSGRTVTTIGYERGNNARIFEGQTREGFLAVMDGLRLAHPQIARFRPSLNQRGGMIGWKQAGLPRTVEA